MGSGVNGEGQQVVGAGPAIHTPMSADRMCLAICPSRDPRHPSVWFARLDVPDLAENWSWSSIAAHPHPGASVIKAIEAVRDVSGDELDALDDARLACLHDLICGADPDEVADALQALAGNDVDVVGCVGDALHCVGFLSSLTKSFKKIIPKPLRGLAKSAMPFFAGFGGPQAQIFSALAQGNPLDAFGAMRGAQMPGGFGGGDQRPAFMRAKEFFSKNPLGPATLPFAQAVLPTIFPGMGSAFMALAAPEAQRAAQLRQVAPPEAAQYGPETWSFGMEPGVVAQPWGEEGPAVMRF
jgi:hypothetical protein